MSTVYSEFHNLFSVSKTLRFSLLPEYETLETIREAEIVDSSEVQANEYSELKQAFDDCHRRYIQKRLSEFAVYCETNKKWLGWSPLKEAYDGFHADANKKAQLAAQKKEYKKVLSAYLKEAVPESKCLTDGLWASIDGSKKAEKMPKQFDSMYVDVLKPYTSQLGNFIGFDGYFKNYNQARENIYAPDGATSIAFRVIDDNFPKFLSNIETFHSLQEDLQNEFLNTLTVLPGGTNAFDMFSVEHYSNLLSQSGIEQYNIILGGQTLEDGTKLQGLNELCNLAYQAKRIPKKLRFVPLFKQILADREQASFLPEMFESARELTEKVSFFVSSLMNKLSLCEPDLSDIFSGTGIDKAKIYVEKKQLPILAKKLGADWSLFNKVKNDAKEKDSCNDYYPLSLLQPESDKDILTGIGNILAQQRIDISAKSEAAAPTLQKDEIAYEGYLPIKELLDSVLEYERLLHIFLTEGDIEKESSFYAVFDDVYGIVREVIPLYNKVRNYATRKPYSESKFKLTFRAPTLMDGWDQNKESDNCCMLFRRGSDYYLGLMNARQKPKLDEKEAKPDESCFEKMVMKFLPGPNKMLPKIFLPKDRDDESGAHKREWKDVTPKKNSHPIPEEIINGYEAGKHLSGNANFDRTFMRALCDYYKEQIPLYGGWDAFNFTFSDTSSYAQCFSMREMGYLVEGLKLHSMDDNRNYPIALPENDDVMRARFCALLEEIRNFNMEGFVQNNPLKCARCIYAPYCDREISNVDIQ